MTFASLIPVKARRIVYMVLGTLFAVEAVWDVVDEGVESRLVLTVGALGFVMARANTKGVE